MRKNNALTTLALASSLAVSSVACKSTSSSRTATGQPLEVRGHYDHVAAYISSDGDYVGAHDNYVFDGFYDGDTQVDDELDYFHVAADSETEQKVADWRKAWNLEVMTGWGSNIVGAAMVVGGLGLAAYSTGGKLDDFNAEDPKAQIGLGVTTAGGILIGASFLLAVMVGPERPLNQWDLVLDPREEATTAATTYNERLSGAAPPTTTPTTESPEETN